VSSNKKINENNFYNFLKIHQTQSQNNNLNILDSFKEMYQTKREQYVATKNKDNLRNYLF